MIHPAPIHLHHTPPIPQAIYASACADTYVPGLRTVRTGYAYQPPACCTYLRHRAACPQGPTHCMYGARLPASGVPYVPRTVAPQATSHQEGGIKKNPNPNPKPNPNPTLTLP